MTKLIITLTTLFFASASYAIDYTTFDCQLRVEREGKADFLMKGLVRITNGEHDENSYLTLEPLSSAELPVTARVLLTRFDGDDYFPMTLHPRGDTVHTYTHTSIENSDVGRLSHEQDGAIYTFVCGKRSTP